MCDTAVQVRRMHTASPPIATFLFDGAASEGQPGCVEKGAKLVRPGHPNHHWRSVGHIPETLFAFPQGLVGVFTLADIHVYAQHANSLPLGIPDYLPLAEKPANRPV